MGMSNAAKGKAGETVATVDDLRTATAKLAHWTEAMRRRYGRPVMAERVESMTARFEVNRILASVEREP